ncbi:MAG TPA: alpha-glucan family phosphorylase [Acidimicrobiales bacterium]|jgi:starch phosphorylase|nr:alpha-glucan family phosphorylase [Acidimicrobiales bacterium]
MPVQQDLSGAKVAYFTMEVALDARIPTYAGGLGVLAGDFLMSAADLGLPLVAVSLAYRKGYFHQVIGTDGGQQEEPVDWERSELLERLATTIVVKVAGSPVTVGAWRYLVSGAGGGTVPVLFLDTDLPANEGRWRDITDQLYGGDDEHRLCQEAVLGLAGVEMLRALGYPAEGRYHMNEGHSSLLTLGLLEDEADSSPAPAPAAGDIEAVRARCAFTTHTPVPAGHDRFAAELVLGVLGEERARLLADLGLLSDGTLNMTTLGVKLSGYVNAVARKHRDVTRSMLPGTDVTSVTNGVHHVRWASAPIREVFDEHIPGWRSDASMLRYASSIPLAPIADAHAAAKRDLCNTVKSLVGADLHDDGLTIGLARRVTPYKRTLLLFSDLERLVAIAERHGPLQVVVSGKAHPRDAIGRQTIARLLATAKLLPSSVRVVFLENYDLALAALLCAGCDVWLNTPQAPLEASGTSGMKAAINGVPSLSILDGWWLEGWVEGVTGWSIGAEETASDASAPPEVLEERSRVDAARLYEKLQGVVAPLYYGNRTGFFEVARGAIALNGSFFSTERMAREYAQAAYGLRV